MKAYNGSFTISASSDNHAENHSRRAYTPFSAEASLSGRNIVIYDCGDDRTHFNDFFREAILDYNSRQSRADRKKDLDYLRALEDGREGYGTGDKKEKPFCHDVIQIGDRMTNGITDDSFDVDHWRELKRQNKKDEAAAYVAAHLPKPGTDKYRIQQDLVGVLKEIAEEIRDNKDKMYTNILIHGLTIHFDEPNGTPHLDFRYSIFTDNEKTGLSKRVSMNKGLKKMGYIYTKDEPAIVKFREDIKNRIERKMAERGYGRDAKNEHKKHLSTAAYELEKRAEIAERRYADAEKRISEIVIKEQEANKLLETARQIRRVLEKLIRKVQNELLQQKLKTVLSQVEIPESDVEHSLPGDANDCQVNEVKENRNMMTTIDGKPVLSVEDFIDSYALGADRRLDTNRTYVAQAIQIPGATKITKQKDKCISR